MKGKHWFFSGTLVLIMVLSVVQGFISICEPYVGLQLKRNDGGELVVSKIRDFSWSAAKRIQPGDILRKVNGMPPDEKIVRTGGIGTADSLEIERNGRMIRMTVFKYDTSSSLVLHTIVPVGLFLVLLLLSGIIYKRKGTERDARLLILFLLCIGLSYMAAGVSSRGIFFGVFITRVSILLIPTLLLHFLYVYTQRLRAGGFPLFWIVVGYGLSLVLPSLDALYLFGLFESYHTNLANQLTLSAFSFMNLVVFYLLVANYAKYRKTDYNPVFSVMLFGQIAAFFPFIAVFSLPMVFFSVELIPGEVASCFLIFIPITYFYLIISKRLFDIEFILGRLWYHALFGLLPAVGIVTFSYPLLRKHDHPLVLWIQSFLIVYFIIILILFIKEKLDTRLQRRLTPYKYNLHNLLDRISQLLSRMMTIAQLEEFIVHELLHALPVPSVSILEVDHSSKQISVRKLAGSWKDPDFNGLYALLSAESLSRGHWSTFELGLVTLLDGQDESRPILIWISNKWNFTKFNIDELIFLKSLLSYVLLVHDNLKLVDNFIVNIQENLTRKHETPSWMLRLLFSLSEKERRRLSSDLHDSALQEQFVWYRRLEKVIEEKTDHPLIFPELEQIKEGLLDVITQIRETCNELRPPFLSELGIVEAVENLLSQIRIRSNLDIRFYTGHFHAELAGEQLLTLYRVIQELMQNAIKHANAKQIELKLTNTFHHIMFTYRDDGVGMDSEKLSFSFEHMGLTGIRERVLSMDGTAEFQTAPGNGLYVRISLPINLAQHYVMEN